METRKRIAFGIAFTTITAVCAVYLLSAGVGQPVDTVEPVATVPLTYANYVEVRKNGVLVATARNTVLYTGMNHTRDVLMGQVAAGNADINGLILSTNATAVEAGEYNCSGEVLSNGLDASTADTFRRTGAPGTAYAQGNVSIIKEWTATGTQSGIASVCLINGTTGGGTGIMNFSRALLSSAVNMENGDTLNVSYYVKVS